MKKILFLLCFYNIFALSETIDKKKILEIIKAAKQHKSITIEKTKVEDKEPIVIYKVKKDKNASKLKKDKNIIIYRKSIEPTEVPAKMSITKQKTEYGTLPMLGLSSEELRRKYETEITDSNKKTLFTVPQSYNTNNKEKTTATKINF